MPIEMTLLDADDTLWHYERYVRRAQAHLPSALDDHPRAGRFKPIELRDIALYRFGSKGSVLPMTARMATATPSHDTEDLPGSPT